MEEPELKFGIGELEQLQCHTCLSVGRKLVALGKLTGIYRSITSGLSSIHNAPELTTERCICWECHAMLWKLHLFQARVQRAQQIIMCQQNHLYGTLSSLTTIVINDTYSNTVYFNDNPHIQTDFVKNETDSDESIDCHHIDGKIEKYCNIDDDYCAKTADLGSESNDENVMKSVKAETNYEIVEKAEKRRQKDDKKRVKSIRWAQKRAIQNKTPKFKILNHKDIDVDSAFKSVQIDVTEIHKCNEKERDDQQYLVSKYKCETCAINFVNNISLEKHRSYHNKHPNLFICDLCKTVFTRKSKLSTHIADHCRKYVCCLCQYTCFKKGQRKPHVKKKHRMVFECIKCGLKFGNRDEFFKHFIDWHEKFVCDHCGVSFKMRYCIKEHINKQHSPHECKKCNKRFARSSGLWLHNKTRHAPAGSPAYCVECDKGYVDVYRYRWHLANSARHTPKKTVRIPCPDCDKIFSKNIYMKDHHHLVHLKQYRYRCEKCDKNFIRNADLVKHRRRVHEGILPPKDKICYVCGKAFTTNKILMNHIRTHTGERPYACPCCPARFTQRAALNGHAKALHCTTSQGQ